MVPAAETKDKEEVNVLAAELLGLASATVASETAAVLRSLSDSMSKALRACRPGRLRRLILLPPSRNEVRSAVEAADAEVVQSLPRLLNTIDVIHGRIACYQRIASRAAPHAEGDGFNIAARIALSTAGSAAHDELRLVFAVREIVHKAIPLWRTAAAGYLASSESSNKVAAAAEFMIGAAAPVLAPNHQEP